MRALTEKEEEKDPGTRSPATNVMWGSCNNNRAAWPDVAECLNPRGGIDVHVEMSTDCLEKTV